MGKDDQLAYAYSILDRAVSLHKPKYAVTFFSGGYDSLVTTHLTMSYMERYYPKLPRFVAHINTGIGIEETAWSDVYQGEGMSHCPDDQRTEEEKV